MKKFIATILFGVILASSIFSAMPVQAEEATATEIGNARSKGVQSVYNQYLDVLQRYKLAQDNNFYKYPISNGVNALQRLDVNTNLAASGVNTLEYALVDFTQDGTQELLIASADYQMPALPYIIYDIFSLVDGKIMRPINDASMGYRSWYTVTENGYLDHLSFVGAKNEIHEYLTIAPKNGALVYDKWIEYESWTNDQYYMNYGENADYQNKFAISKAEYDAIKAQYPAKQNIVWHSISDYASLWTELNKNNIPVYVNGVQVEFDQQPLIIEDRVMVPLRAIFEALGAHVIWDNASRSIISTQGDTTIIMTVDSNTIYRNGVATMIDVPPQIINDRTLVPVRAIAEAFDCKVTWNSDNRTVNIDG